MKKYRTFDQMEESYFREHPEEMDDYPNKTDIINDLIRREREREEKFSALKAAIEEGLSSGISDKTVEDIRNDVLKRLRENGQISA